MDGVRHGFVDAFKGHLATIWKEETMSVVAEAMFERLYDDVNRDLEFWERSSSAQEEFDEIRHFLKERPKILLPLLEQFYDDPNIEETQP
jgi:hypothetical protein